MARVTGVGGVFFLAKDPEKLLAWYRDRLGLEVEQGYPCSSLYWDQEGVPGRRPYTVFAPFAADTDYFQPSRSSFMINFRVDDLDALLAKLGEAGVEPVGSPTQEINGRFAWVLDPEGNKVELWEPAPGH